MTKINWKSKLTSRKFWTAVLGFVTALLVAFNVDSLTVEQVTAVISACSVLVAYIIGEGLVDSRRGEGQPEASEVSATGFCYSEEDADDE